MATPLITLLSVAVTLLVAPWVWRIVIRRVHSRANTLMARDPWVALHHDLWIRVYLVAGLLTTVGLFLLSHVAFTHGYTMLHECL